MIAKMPDSKSNVKVQKVKREIRDKLVDSNYYSFFKILLRGTGLY